MAKTKYESLSEKQQAWVDEYIARGGSRSAATDAVVSVYGYEPRIATSYASRMLRNDNIREVLGDMTIASFAPLAVLANEQLVEMLTTGLWHGQIVKPSDGLKAIKEVLERGIGPVVQKRELEITDNRSLKEVQASLVDKLSQLTDDDKRKLGLSIGQAIDAEFEAVDPAAPWGRKKDGTAKQKPGVPAIEKRVLRGPDAFKPEIKSELAKMKARIKERKLRAYKHTLVAAKEKEETNDA